MSNFKPDLLLFLRSTNTMEVVMRLSSRRTVIVLAVINLFFTNVAFSSNPKMYPEDLQMESCTLSNGKDGMCVYGYLCHDNIINIDGSGIIDLRFSDVCEDYFLKCCSKETPCQDNRGTCVSARNCGANLNDPKYKKFKQSEECDWSGYTCCPNDKVGQNTVTNQTDSERCDTGSFCVPDEQCTANPDGAFVLAARSSSDCAAPGHTCCPEGAIILPEDTTETGPTFTEETKKTGSTDVPFNSIEQYEMCDDNTVCVSDDQCLVKPDGDSIIQARVSTCNGINQTCCPKDKVKGGDPCNEVGGVCMPENACPDSSSLKLDLRIDQCEEFGFVCCMQDSTHERDQFINKSCSGGKGKCAPRKQCRGTTYRDRTNECGGLACCATLSTDTTRPAISSSTTRKPAVSTVSTSTDNENEGKACSHNMGKCTKGTCAGTKYKDRQNVCGGLNCCAPSGFSHTTMTPRPLDNEKEGKACFNGLGKCRRKTCAGTTYYGSENECGALNCCAEIQVKPTTERVIVPHHSCSSVGGKCMLGGNCLTKTDSPVDDCEAHEVCCIQERHEDPTELPKECGYRNENGVKFQTIGRNDGESQFGEFPWMVAIMVVENGKAKYTCGGSLIDPEVVLTTAACVKSFSRSPDRLIIRAGEWDLGTTREPFPHEERGVIKIKTHPDFKATTLVNNIALLFLNDRFDLNSRINTVCLPPQGFGINNGYVTASGWGSTPQDRTKYQQILKSFELRFVERSECESILRSSMKNRSFKLHQSFMCVGGEAGSDTCAGDGGSPVVYQVPNDFDSRYYAVGMVSWGIGCGRGGIPAAYTDVGFFRDWIDKEMEKERLYNHYYTYAMPDVA